MLTKTKKIIKRVAFFGDAEAKPHDLHFRQAVKVAKILAENGYIIINGGGPGVMLASTVGAKMAGGQVEVVVLDPKKEPGNYEGISIENIKQVDKIFKTDSYEHRVGKLMEIADAYVVFRGGAGTLSEVGMTWEQAKFNYGNHEPLIFYGKCWKRIVRDLITDLKLELMEQRVVEVLLKPEAVVKALKQVGS